MRFHVDDAVLILKRSFNEQKAAPRYQDAVALEDVRRENHVGDTGFVLQRKKDKPLGSAGPLTCDNAAGDAHGLIAAAVNQFVSRADALATQRITVIGHRVGAGGKAGACVVRREALVGCHLPQRCGKTRCIGIFACALQQWTNRTASLFHLPESVAAMCHFTQRVECADACKRDKLFTVERGYTRSKFIHGCKIAFELACREQRLC